MDLLMYVSRGCPELLREEITNYPVKYDWPALFAHAISHPQDDGHLAKFVRTVAHGEKVCKSFESQGPQAMPVSGKMWLQIGNMGKLYRVAPLQDWHDFISSSLTAQQLSTPLLGLKKARCGSAPLVSMRHGSTSPNVPGSDDDAVYQAVVGCNW